MTNSEQPNNEYVYINTEQLLVINTQYTSDSIDYNKTISMKQ